MRVFLSGMPELRLGLNDKVLFENTGREFSLIADFGHIVLANDLSWVWSYPVEVLIIMNYPFKDPDTHCIVLYSSLTSC